MGAWSLPLFLGPWRLVFGILVFGDWDLEFGPCCLGLGTWSMVFWHFAFGICDLALIIGSGYWSLALGYLVLGFGFGIWDLACVCCYWSLVLGHWYLVFGICYLALIPWPLVIGSRLLILGF